MRPLPWTIRVSLFALGFGLGLSQFKPAATSSNVILEIHLAVPASAIKSPAAPACAIPLPLENASTQMSRVRL
jgi:hypothetical protein